MANTENEITIIWIGRAIGKNRKRIIIRKGTRKGTTFMNSDYVAFQKSLIDCFQRKNKQFKGEIDVIMNMTIHNRADHHNFIEPIADAMQKSGIIENDRLIALLVLPRPTRHGNGESDVLKITIRQARGLENIF